MAAVWNLSEPPKYNQNHLHHPFQTRVNELSYFLLKNNNNNNDKRSNLNEIKKLSIFEVEINRISSFEQIVEKWMLFPELTRCGIYKLGNKTVMGVLWKIEINKM